MTLRDLGPWLLKTPGFRRRLHALIADAVCSEFKINLSRREEWQDLNHDWRFLLLSASVLAGSEDGACQNAALRIAQACITAPDTPPHRRDAAALVLDAMANHPAIALAIRRQFLKTGPETRLPAPARLEWARRSVENSIVLSNDAVLRVNRFQRLFWDAANAHDWVSVSAATSTGKSYIMTRWIVEQLRSNPLARIVYVVPTRALINQVENDLRAFLLEEGLSTVKIFSIPVVRSLAGDQGTVLVFTQERLHMLLTAAPDFGVDVLVVDEAHKVGDRQRGVLLQHVIERVVEKNPALKVIFASPMASNPEALLADATKAKNTSTLTSNEVTVSQNLVWVSQRSGSPRHWDVTLCLPNRQLVLGEVVLPAKPSAVSKRLSFVAFAMAGLRAGNIVYVNGAAEAETISAQLYDLSGSEGEVRDERIDDLIELARRTVHPKFRLGTFLRRGIAFHYGNLPLLIRTEIERLFSEGLVRYLVCTSTLIEGVNMSCRTIFLRGPRKGRGRPMSAEDFWNLAGRAGRWGRDFQGSIVCVDAERTDVWGAGGPPRVRTRYAIQHTADLVLRHPDTLLEYIDAGAPRTSTASPELEYVFSYLVSIHARHGSVLRSPWAARYPERVLKPIAAAIDRVAESLATPLDIVDRNPGINPFAMDGLLGYFRTRDKPVDELLPVDPADGMALSAYTRIFVRLARELTPRLGPTPGRAAMLALTVLQWMRGSPLAHLINRRIEYYERKKQKHDTARVIRAVMEEVEQIARFEAPKALAVYRDLLTLHLASLGRGDLIERMPDLNVFLELGVGQPTQVSLMGIGLSRSSAIGLSELIAADDLTEQEALHWLRENSAVWSESDLPALVKREVAEILRTRSTLV